MTRSVSLMRVVETRFRMQNEMPNGLDLKARKIEARKVIRNRRPEDGRLCRKCVAGKTNWSISVFGVVVRSITVNWTLRQLGDRLPKHVSRSTNQSPDC